MQFWFFENSEGGVQSLVIDGFVGLTDFCIFVLYVSFLGGSGDLLDLWV